VPRIFENHMLSADNHGFAAFFMASNKFKAAPAFRT